MRVLLWGVVGLMAAAAPLGAAGRAQASAGTVARTVPVSIRAGIVMGDLSVRAIPHLELRVLDGSGAEAARTETDLDGLAHLALAPGGYTVESTRALNLWGTTYAWSVPVQVAPGLRTVELTQKNAGFHAVDEGMAAAAPSDDEALFRRLEPGVFTVYGSRGFGTGFLIDARGLVLTSGHVIDPEDEVRVAIDEGRKVRATVVSFDRDHDLALLAINMTRCGGCQPLALAETVKAGERVMAIGSAEHHTPPYRPGTVTKTEAPLIFSDARVEPGFSGGPLVTLDGRVLGVTMSLDPFMAAGRGASGAVSVIDARAVIAAARDRLPSAVAARPPDDVLIPSLPRQPYPAEALRQVARQSTFDLLPYRFERDKFNVAVMTPPVMTWRQTEALREAQRSGMAKVDVVQLWSRWDEYVEGGKAAVVLHVWPKVGKKGVLGSIAATVASIATMGASTIITTGPAPGYEFKSDFRDMKLFRDGVEVPAAERYRIPVVAETYGAAASQKQLSYQGMFVFRPEDFAPGADGHAPVFRVEIRNGRSTKPVVFTLDPLTVKAIQRDFAAWRVAAAR